MFTMYFLSLFSIVRFLPIASQLFWYLLPSPLIYFCNLNCNLLVSAFCVDIGTKFLEENPRLQFH
jgi:hypothetical protein